MASSSPKKIALRLLAAAVGLVIIFLLTVLRHSKTRFAPVDGDWLQISAKYQLPLQELSGMARFGDKLYVVGDSTAELAIVDFATMQVLEKIDFSDILRQRFSLCITAQNNTCRDMLNTLATQWEGIYVHDDGVALLQENTGSVYVFDLPVTKLKEHFLIDYRIDQTDEPQGNDNSLGEGIMLLGDGKLLIAKEKSPTAIMEFAVQRQVDHAGIVRKEMQATHTWRLASEDKQCDLSDLTKDPNSGRIYGISQICRAIYKFRVLDKDSDELEVEQRWRIPDVVTAPEALVVMADGEFIVCSDTKQVRDNVYVLK